MVEMDTQDRMITLEDIKKMDLQVGTPIELSIRIQNYPRHAYTERVVSYFKSIDEQEQCLWTENNLMSSLNPTQRYFFRVIDDIKVLEYKK